MPRWLLIIALLFAPALSSADEPVANTMAVNGHNFTLPTGFGIELVAGPPLVDRPITIDFDEQGRLYVAESSGSNEKVELQLEKKPHRILRLEDSDGDGRFDQRTVFADGLMLPEGTMWYAGSLYVAAPPSIWKLTDTDGNGVADQRSEWFQGKTLTGCANDLHGPYLGLDGWIYWCKGAFAQQTYQRPDGTEWSTKASHVFRCRPDGTGLEPVMTGGMDNPVDLAFMSSGERIVSNTFIVHPGGGQRDGLIHAVYGGIYGKDHEPIYQHPWTSPHLMPVLSHLGPAAACGLHRWDSMAWGEEYFDNLFTCCFNMRKVTRTILTPRGASYVAQNEDWLVSDHVDFHPTDVLEDADGSLLVVDTGGWYKLCCPTSQIQKPDVLGGIYRIRKQDAKPLEDPRGKKIAWKELTPDRCAKLLGDERPVVQRRAMETLAAQGRAALPALEEALSEESIAARRNVYWTLCRIDHAEARRISARGMSDADPGVRQVAGHAAALWRDPAGIGLQVRSQAANRRVAAEVAGRAGDLEAYEALLALFSVAPEPGQADRELEHSMIYAMFEIAGRHRETFSGTAGKPSKYAVVPKDPRQARAVLTVLDQLKSPALRPEMVVAVLDSRDAELRHTALWILARHPEWGEQIVAALRQQLAGASRGEEAVVAQKLAPFARLPPVQSWLAEIVSDPKSSLDLQRSVVTIMGTARPVKVPDAWLESLGGFLATTRDEADQQLVATTARNLLRDKQSNELLNRALLKLGGNDQLNAGLRLIALSAVADGIGAPDEKTLKLLREQLANPDQAEACALAGEILGKAKLGTTRLLALTADFQSLGALEADTLLKAFTQSTDDEVGFQLVAALQASRVKASLPVGVLRERLKKFSPLVQNSAETLYAELDAAAGQQKERLESLVKSLPTGDVRRGQQVFHSAKAVCAQCHAIGYAGGTVGPDLTRIGLVRTERDLLESLLFPSNSFVQGYEPNQVVTTDGKTYNGLIRKPIPGEVTVITGANQSVRLSPDEIEETTLSKVSVMPAGLDQQLTIQQIADLVTYLKSCR